MFFRKKKIRCRNCNSDVEPKFSFCPYCGYSVADKQKEMKEFGLLGKNDNLEPQENIERDSSQHFGFTDKIFNSLMNSMMKSLNKQFKEMGRINPEELDVLENASIEQFPNGIKIKIGMPAAGQPKPKQVKRKEITEAQLEKMSRLPRAEAKTKITRLSDKVIYELAAPGIESPNDIFISKLESGYEIKAIAKKKIYTNSISIGLPLRGFSLLDNKLLVEFKIEK